MKSYAYKKMDGKEDKKCKGVKKCVVKETLKLDNYKKCLDNERNVYRQQMMFRNEKHDVYTVNINKIALNRDDDKRIVQEDGFSTLARGHVKGQT